MNRSMPRELSAVHQEEIAARLTYAALPLSQRLVTPPPEGWAGAWAARVVSRCAAMVRKREAAQ